MTNNSSVLLYLFRAQISSNLLGIIYGKKQEPTLRETCQMITQISMLYNEPSKWKMNSKSTIVAYVVTKWK
jgi:hypothetical protein